MQNLFCVFLLLATLLFESQSAFAQVETSLLEGEWSRWSFESELNFPPVEIDSLGTIKFEQMIEQEIEGSLYHFSPGNFLISLPQENNFITFAGGGAGPSEENPRITVTTAYTGAAFVSTDYNLIAGLWKEKQTYKNSLSTLFVVDASPEVVVFTRDGSESASYEGIVGDWTIQLQDQSLTVDWEGSLTLDPSGALMGTLQDSDLLNPFPTVGLYEFEGRDIDFSFSTWVGVGDSKPYYVEITASGRIEEGFTEIHGEFSIVVRKEDEEPGNGITPQQIRESVYTGPFTMIRSDSTKIDPWFLH